MLGAAMNATIVSLGALALVACGPTVIPEAGSSSGQVTTTGAEDLTTTTLTPTTGATTTTSTASTGASDASGSGDSSTTLGHFIVPPDGGSGCGAPFDPDGEFRCVECDGFVQDCPQGDKCVAWADDGGSAWNGHKCVSVTGEGVAGEPCTVEGSGTSGVDDCAFGHMCWDVDDELHGTCVALCTGSQEMPLCADGLGCLIANDGALNLCMPRCDPLLQDCAGDDLCLPSGPEFLCAIDASGDAGAVNDPCTFVNTCDKGLLCSLPSASAACMQDADGCCQPFCSFPGGACPNPDQTCLQFFDPEMGIPPGFEDVGRCGAE